MVQQSFPKKKKKLYLVGENKTLDTNKYYVVTFALFSNGESSSPSNTPSPCNAAYFPAVSYADNIRAQYAVLTKHLGIKHVLCVIGFSMGGQQAYYWPVMYPDFVDKFVVICGSARTSPHNKCFLEGPKVAMLASKDYDGGHYKVPPVHGIRAFGRVYSAWAYSQAWYREHQYLMNGQHADLESFIREAWEGRFLAAWDANDMITLLNTWYHGDISNVHDGGDLAKALRGIKAQGLIMPGRTDLYFPPEDSEYEVEYLSNARLAVIESIWGHIAGGGGNPADVEFIRKEVTGFLQQ